MKKNCKKSISILLLFILVITSLNVVPLEAKAASKVAVSSITFKNATTRKLTIMKGKTYKLGATVAPTNAANKKLSYKSSNSDIVKVNSSGKLTAKETGKATITVTSKSNKKVKAKVVVTVVDKDNFKKVTKVSVSTSSTEIKIGETATIKSSIKPSKASNKNVTYKSSNTNVAMVDLKGKVTAISEGTVTITVSSLDGSKKSGKIDITVKPIDVANITLNKTSVSLIEGNTQQLTATISPDNATHKEASFTSSNASVATIDENGNIKAIQAGTATITAASGNISTTCAVTVTSANQNTTYTVSFQTNGGSTIASQNIANGGMVNCPSDPIRSSYVFTGWYVDSTLSSAYDFNSIVTNNITLYAKWDSVTTSTTVSFQTNGGSTIASQNIANGGMVNCPNDPIRSSYVFAGWYMDGTLSSTYDFNSPVSNNIILYAKWDPVTISLSIQNENSTQTSEISQTITGEVTTNGTISSISYVNTASSDNNTNISGQAMISGNTWSIDNINLMPDENTFTITAVTVDGVSTSQTFNITYDSGYTYTPNEPNVQMLTDTTVESNSDTTSDETGEVSSIEAVENHSGTITQNIDDTTSSGALLGYVDNVILVYFNEDVKKETKDNFVTSIEGTKVGYLNTINQYQIQLSSSKTLDELNSYCDTLKANNGFIKYACLDMVISEDLPIEEAIPNDPWSGDEDWDETSPNGLNWWQEAIDAPSAWDYSDSLSRIKVGIVDNGFDTSHSDLAISFPDSTSESENNAENHGTHVAGIIGATANNNIGITGVNWDVNLVGYDWHPSSGQDWSTQSKIYEGFVKTVEAGAKIVNFSLGTSGSLLTDSSTFDSSYYNNWGKTTSVVMESLLARGFDFVVVQSAGNGAANGIGVDAIYNGLFASVTEDNCYSSSNVDKSDILDRIIIVAAAGQSGSKYKVASFSNGGDQVSIAAPGRTIFSTIKTTDGEYGFMNGTSMSSPMVTGVASLVWSVNSDFTGNEVKEILCNNTDETVSDNTTSTNTNGSYPMVNAKLAVEEAKSRGGIVKAYFSDAATGNRIGANYKIHKNTADGELFDSNTYSSESNGNFQLSGLPAGTYVLEITLDGYVTNYFTINVPIRGEIDLGTISVSKTLSENQYRIVLTWGSEPSDLDSHLRSTNLSGDDIHVFYSNKIEDEANLDVDDVTSYGPETVTISEFSNLNGIRYAVHNYTDRYADSSNSEASNLANSGAVVKVFKGSDLLKTYTVPTNQKGTLWTVFAVDNSGNISDINSVSYEEYPAQVLENMSGVNSVNGISAQNSSGTENLSLEELDPPKNAN
jgi:uncharacterized repeat protein (TIGR02543 family)